MNKKICKRILELEDKLIPSIFTSKQLNILQKYMNDHEMTPAERSYLYSAIKDKVDCLSLFHEEFHINGKDMIPERVRQAKEILKEINYERAFISGSFLYKNNYNDIDIYVISKKRKQFRKEEKHFVFIAESDLEKPIFASSLYYSVSNFPIPKIEVNMNRSEFDENVMAYEIAIGEMLEPEEDMKTSKYLIMEYYKLIKNKILNSRELTEEYENLRKNSNNIEILNKMIREIILFSYSPRYIYDILVRFTKDLGEDIKNYKANDNLIIYKRVFDEIKDECRRAKT